MYGLEAVARVWQRSARDGGERILEIALFERVTQRDLLHVGRIGNECASHRESIANDSESIAKAAGNDNLVAAMEDVNLLTLAFSPVGSP